MKIEYQSIGIIHSPFRDIKGMPIQPAGAEGVRGTIEIFPAFAQGLQDLDGFSHVILLYHFHKNKRFKLIVTPFLDSRQHGVFSTRVPRRPNSIGLSIVKLLGIKENILDIENVDILDETPLIDIKPYVQEFDQPPADRFGWFEQAKGKVQNKKSDDRFK